jgi:hypothetical protein
MSKNSDKPSTTPGTPLTAKPMEAKGQGQGQGN